ncbi:MAG TPA: GNAT family N-acetyltransferase [Thermoanaerobaculia bacterium]|nr:GNAT family N-acetyltransferase [Thermoanaerobaculia bacterium]
MKHRLRELRITTDRLVLVPVGPAHRTDIFREFTPELTIYMAAAPAAEIGDTDRFIRESIARMERDEEIVCAVLARRSDELLGVTGLHRIHTPTPELGVWIKRGAHGNGYGREAVAALKAWADQHLEVEYIRYPVAAANRASRKIAEALGGELVREFEDANHAGIRMPWTEYRFYKVPAAGRGR